MNIYSRWMLTDGSNRALVTDFATSLGDRDLDPGKTSLETGTLYRRVMQYQGRKDSPWILPVSNDGQWVVGTADLDAGDLFSTRLVGVMTPSAAVTEHLCADLTELLNKEGSGCDAVVFSLRSLLTKMDKNEVQPMSVRLQSEAARILVQASDETALRSIISELPGDLVGLTMKSKEAKGAADMVTVTEDGSVIFTDTTAAEDVIASIQQIAQSIVIRVKSVAT